jgi:hypothetical protein
MDEKEYDYGEWYQEWNKHKSGGNELILELSQILKIIVKEPVGSRVTNFSMHSGEKRFVHRMFMVNVRFNNNLLYNEICNTYL